MPVEFIPADMQQSARSSMAAVTARPARSHADGPRRQVSEGLVGRVPQKVIALVMPGRKGLARHHMPTVR